MGLWMALDWRIGMRLIGLDLPIVQRGCLRTRWPQRNGDKFEEEEQRQTSLTNVEMKTKAEV